MPGGLSYTLILNKRSTFHVCQQMRPAPAKAPIHPLIFPSQTWSRIHVNFAEPIPRKLYVFVVDAYSKLLGVVNMPNTTATTSVCLSLPEVLVSYTGLQFILGMCLQFCHNNGTTHWNLAAHKPSTNLQTERGVQILKLVIEQT